MMKVRVGRAAAWVTVSAAVFMVCAVPAVAAAEGAPSLTPGSPYTVWAYGGVRNVSFAGASAHSGWAYRGSATFGYSVVLNQTNLSTTSFELDVNRTMGASLSIDYCSPTCAHPVESSSILYRAWESDDEWANFTTAGTVYEDGSPVAAVALNNSHSTVMGSLLDRATGPARSDFLVINVSSAATVNFATPLGLIPDSLAAGAHWNASSAFAASGTFSLSWFYGHVGPLGSYNLTGAPITGSVSGSGNVSVLGAAGSGSVELGGASYQNVSLAVLGPFTVREGFILVPTEVDLFGGSSESPLSNASGASAAAMTSIYARPFVGGHFGVGGSEWTFASSAINPSDVVAVPSGSGVTELASGADQVDSTTVQGVPMSVDQANGVQKCLVSGTTCPAGPGGNHLLGGLLVVGGVVVAAVLIAMVVVVDRRRMPPPRRSNVGLYPPVVTVPGRASDGSAGGTNPPPPPPPEDDPLAHLW